MSGCSANADTNESSRSTVIRINEIDALQEILDQRNDNTENMELAELGSVVLTLKKHNLLVR